MAANGADTPSARGTTPTNRVIAAMFADQLEGAADMPTPSDLFQSECRGNTSPARSADASNKRGISPRKTSSPASKKTARSPLRSALVYAANTAALIINAVIPPNNDNILPPPAVRRDDPSPSSVIADVFNEQTIPTAPPKIRKQNGSVKIGLVPKTMFI